MKTEITTTPWTYRVFVSKDSSKNVMRYFRHLPDNEYSRGYYHPVTYTELKEAKSALAYFENGFIEKKRHVTTKYAYGRGVEYKTETVKI